MADTRKPAKKRKLPKESNEAEEEWTKYIKLEKTADNDKHKKKSITTSTSNQSKKTMTKEEKEQRKKKKNSSLLKHREPCDLMRNETRLEELNGIVEHINNVSETNCHQKALSIKLLPPRSRQSLGSLELGAEQYKTPMVGKVCSDTDFSIALKRMNYERSIYAANEHIYPLQDLMGDQGFFSINNEHVDHVLKCIIKDKRTDINYAKYSRAEAAKEKKKKGGSEIIVNGNKKLNQIHGNKFHSFGYNRRTPQVEDKKMKVFDTADREIRFKKFFQFDQLEDETNYGEIPETFRMFRQLRRDHGEKYKRREEIQRDYASLKSTGDLEEISKEYIMEFRQPPLHGEPLCANGARCVFNTFSSDKAACYIGKVFYTEREKRQFTPNENFSDRLCYECLIKSWTIQWALNIANEVIPERHINYFTVMCRPGQYSPHCMLKMVENDKPTGIIGNVPRFSRNNRRIVTHQLLQRINNKDVTISVPVLVETGMDF